MSVYFFVRASKFHFFLWQLMDYLFLLFVIIIIYFYCGFVLCKESLINLQFCVTTKPNSYSSDKLYIDICLMQWFIDVLSTSCMMLKQCTLSTHSLWCVENIHFLIFIYTFVFLSR